MNEVRMDRQMDRRNFGLQSRDAGRSLITAYRLEGNAYASDNTVKTTLIAFADHLKNTFNIKDLRKVEKEHVLSYAHSLNKRFESGEISASTAQNYLSPINIALSNARLDNNCQIDSVKDAGLPSRSGIVKEDKSISSEEHEQACSIVSERLEIQLTLQRELGLRMKESCLIDAKTALIQAQSNGTVLIVDGTKGGREREIPITKHSQIETLQRAADLQKNDFSLIPSNQTWAQYQSQVYREMSQTNIHCHQERHHFANHTYQKLMGCLSPVQAQVKHSDRFKYISAKLGISIAEAKEKDFEVRLSIAEMLGHSRISITNNYIG